MKDFEGGLFDGGSEVGVLEEGTNLSPRATVFVVMRMLVMRVVMRIVFMRGFDNETGTSQTASESVLRFQDHFFREVKTLDSILKEGQGHT
jgi:hypothetical protein